MRTIVSLVDFSDAAPKVIEQTQTFAQALDARVILLHVVPKDHVVLDLAMVAPVIRVAPGPAAIKADFDRLTTLGRPLTASGIDTLVEQLNDADVEGLIQKCAHWEADLIIVGSHQHSALYNWLIGSITGDVLKSARCPVLVVPADRAAK